MYRARPSTNNATTKRIQREIADCMKEEMGEITLKPSESNMFNWTASIPGPEGSVYEGGVFKLAITLPPDYPFSSPRVTFETRIYHMNISPTGAICIDVLKSQWSPALSLFKVLLSLSSLLTDPNPKDPLVPPIALEYTRNRAQHDATAREWTRMYAMPAAPPPKPKEKGKARALPSASNFARATPSAPTAGGRPDVIEVSSDVEELPTGGRHASQAIEIDSEDDVEVPVAPRPTRAKKGRGRPVAAASSSRSTTAGVKRRDPPEEDEGDVEPSSSSSLPRHTSNTRNTRSSKRQARGGAGGGSGAHPAPNGDTIVID